MFKDTNSHGLVSRQFLDALEIFFGLDFSIPKHAITELYKNLLQETLSGARDIEFDAVSDLVGELSFNMKGSTLLNRRRKENEDKKKKKEMIRLRKRPQFTTSYLISLKRN